MVSELDVSELDVSELDVSELDGGVIDGLMSVVDSDAGVGYEVDVVGVVVGTSDRAVAVVVATVGGAIGRRRRDRAPLIGHLHDG